MPAPQSPQHQPDTKNLAVAIAISLAILLGFQYFYEAPREKARLAEAAAQRAASEAQLKAAGPANTAPGTQASAAAPGAPPAIPTAQSPVSRQSALALSPRVILDADGMDGSLSTLGARFDDLKLKRYKETVQKTSPEITLLHPQGTADGYYAFFGWSAPDGGVGALPGPNTVWSVPEGARLTPETPVTFTYDNGAGLTFARKVEIDRNYLFTITDTVNNTSAAAVTLQNYGAVRRHAKPKDPPNGVIHEGMVGVLDGKLKLMKYNDLEKGKALQQASTGGWLGYSDKFWLAALIPDQKTKIDASYKTTMLPGEEVFEASFIAAPVAIGAGQSLTTTQRLYSGAKRVSELERVGKELGLQRFDDAVDWGMFWFLTKPFYQLLMFFYGLIGNVGLAILAVTVVVKVVTFPLVYSSYKSFGKLRELAPKMAEIKERFAADTVRQQQETMKLYQSEKVNPVAGCVPALLQMPIFFALFKVLSISLELRHTPFYGWIPDLSAKDPTTVFNLFGLLPYDPTSWPIIGTFLAIGAWPILYGMSFWLLNKMQMTTVTDPIQAQIFALMPWIFVFVFAGFGSGLVIYYTWSNLLTILQQYAIAKRTGSPNAIDDIIAKLRKPKEASVK